MRYAPALTEARIDGVLAGTIRRYGLASVSSAIVSVAHLAVQLVAIRSLAAREIGLLAFMITLIQFGFGLSNALVAAPYTILVNRADASRDEGAALFTIDLLMALGYGALCFAVGDWIDGARVGLGFGMAAFLLLLRWFGRADAYAHHAPQRAALSDIAYAAMMAACIVTGLMTHISLPFIACWFLAAGVAGLVPFGWSLVRRHLAVRPGPALRAYRVIWKSQASWALVGVVTTEATANGHSYLVTALSGPAAFAPIAIGTLFLRPLSVCITALTQMERPRMVRDLDRGDRPAAVRSARHFGLALGAVWLGTIALAAAVLLFLPRLILKPSLDPHAVTIAVGLCGIVALTQCAQTPWNVLLQATDRFRPLAMASIRACVVTLAGTSMILLIAAPVWSLLGVIAGQAVMLAGILLAVRSWRQERAPVPESAVARHTGARVRA